MVSVNLAASRALRVHPGSHWMRKDMLVGALCGALQFLARLGGGGCRNVEERLIGVGGDRASGIAQDALGVLALLGGPDPLGHESAVHADPAIARGQVFQSMARDRTLGHLR